MEEVVQLGRRAERKIERVINEVKERGVSNQGPVDHPTMRDSVAINVPISEILHSTNEAAYTGIKCCGIHPKLIGFFVKVSICVLVMGFSMYKLGTGEPCPCSDDSSVYISLISSILSYFVGQHTR